MKYTIVKILTVCISLLPGIRTLAAGNDAHQLSRDTRLVVIEGNKLYNAQRFAEAEATFKKALEMDPNSDLIKYNLAAAYLRQGVTAEKDSELQKEALSLLDNLVKNSSDSRIAELAAYNAGNMMFNNEKYAESIEYYKHSLRRNPDNDKARENLRLAQLKLEQQQNNQNQDQNQQEEKQQEQQQDQQQQEQQQEQQPQPKQPQQQKQDMDQQNMEAILKTMQNEENKTRERIEKRKTADPSRRTVTKPW